MRDMAQLRLQVLLPLLLLVITHSPLAGPHPSSCSPLPSAPTLPRLLPSWPPRSPPEAHSSQGLAVWLLSLLPLSLLFLFTLTLVSVYFSSEVIGRRSPLSLGQQEEPSKSPFENHFPCPAAEPTQLHPLCLLSPARGLSAGREPTAAQGPVSNVTLPRP